MDAANRNKFCEICHVVLSGGKNANEHYMGRKHQTKVGIFNSQKSIAGRTVFLGKLPPMIMEIQLHDLMSQFGSVSKVNIDRRAGQFAFVEFSDAASQNRALAARMVYASGFAIPIFRRTLNPPTNPNARSIIEEPDQFGRLVERVNARLQKIQEIPEQFEELYSTVKLTPRDFQERRRSLDDIYNVLKRFYPKCSLQVYGSTVNGYGFQYCDMDIGVSVPELEEAQKKQVEPKLSKAPTIRQVERGDVTLQQLYTLSIRETVRFFHMLIRAKVRNMERVIFIPSVRCPIVRFINKNLGIYCDLSCGKEIGLINSNLLQLMGRLDMRVTHLIVLLRYWAKLKDLLGSGPNFTSYAFTWLVIFYLQKRDPPVLPTIDALQDLAGEKKLIGDYNVAFCNELAKIPKIENKESTSDLLKGFFSYFLNLDLDQFAICPKDGQVIPKDALKDKIISYGTLKMSPLCVQDPFELDRNITVNLPQAHVIKFLQCLQQGQEAVQNKDFGLWPGLLVLFDPVDKTNEADRGKSRNKRKALKRALQKNPDLIIEEKLDERQVDFDIRLTEEYFTEGQSSDDVVNKICQTLISILEHGLMFECTIVESILELHTTTKIQPDSSDTSAIPETEPNEPAQLDIDSSSLAEAGNNSEENPQLEDKLEPPNRAQTSFDGDKINVKVDADEDMEPSRKRAKINEDGQHIDTAKVQKRSLACIDCLILNRVWKGRKKIAINDTGMSVLDAEAKISQIVIKSSGEPSQPVCGFRMDLTERKASNVTVLNVCLKHTQLKEFGNVSAYLGAYLPKIIKRIFVPEKLE